jgi:hypothetical protein
MYYIGIDIGKSVDHTAIVIVERSDRGLGLCYAERLPLGTSYPDVVEHVRWIVTHEKVRGGAARGADGMRDRIGGDFGRGEDDVRERQ